jgi:hypothetical protein
VNALPHAAGLNPDAFRRRYAKIPLKAEGAAPFNSPLHYASQGILDGDVLLRFPQLGVQAQGEVLARAGLVWGEVMAALSVVARLQQMY